MSDKQREFWEHRFKTVPGIRAVGRRDKSAEINQAQYAQAADVFRALVKDDFPERSGRRSVLDVGYGLGHYARLCHSFGFESYLGVDFASPPLPDLGKSYRAQTVDFGKPVDLKRKFQLVIAIDVAYHVVNNTEFENFIENIRAHALERVYVTGLFYRLNASDQMSHCRHRAMERYNRLGTLIDVRPWRDNMIARFRVSA